VEFADIFCWRCLHEYHIKQCIRRQDALAMVVLPNQARPTKDIAWRVNPSDYVEIAF
jgi:hypothetical protein